MNSTLAPADLERCLTLESPGEIKRPAVKTVLGEHYVDPVSANYAEVGFAGWERDEHAHYAFAKLADCRYALIYSRDDRSSTRYPSINNSRPLYFAFFSSGLFRN
jgi:hypothetical protein